MKVKIGNEIIDSNDEPIMLIFENDDQRKKVAANLASMEDKPGIRKYCEFNNDKITLNDVADFMKDA